MPVHRQPNPVLPADYQRLRDVLIEARRRAGISQRELAARIGKSHSQVFMIEPGQRRGDVLEFPRIARSLQVGALALFGAATAMP